MSERSRARGSRSAVRGSRFAVRKKAEPCAESVVPSCVPADNGAHARSRNPPSRSRHLQPSRARAGQHSSSSTTARRGRHGRSFQRTPTHWRARARPSRTCAGTCRLARARPRNWHAVDLPHVRNFRSSRKVLQKSSSDGSSTRPSSAARLSCGASSGTRSIGERPAASSGTSRNARTSCGTCVRG